MNLIQLYEALLVKELKILLLCRLLVDLVELDRAFGEELGGEVEQAVTRVPLHFVSHYFKSSHLFLESESDLALV